MANEPKCRKCGALLTPDARDDVCPKCLLRLALAGPEAGESTGTPAAGLAVPRDFAQRQSFGDYELLEEIARGGMGVVYKARQMSLGRLVAVKMLLFGPHAGADFIKRFRVEASAAAALQHPNIVAIHEVGVHEGEHFLVMDYVDGPNLAKLVKDQPLPVKRAALYLKTIAEAVQYAHEKGILHRDLKCSNVLIDSDDQPRLTDFGLAKRLGTDSQPSTDLSQLTLSGQVMGSPGYMPPEQASGVRGKMNRRSDIYSLGAMLYHLVTGRPPFGGGTLAETLYQVQHQDPVSPRLLNPSVPLDLETICLKCLEKESARRYHTAKELSDELGRFLHDQPILARPVGLADKAWRWCRRKPAVTGALAVALIATGAAGFLGYQGRRVEQQRFEERRQSAMEKAWLAVWSGDLDRAEAAIREAELAGATVSELRMLRGHLAFHRGAYDEAIQHLEQAARLAPQSVAAHALLSQAYARIGHYEKSELALIATTLHPAKTPEDYLFKGLAEADWGDAVRGQATLDLAVQRHPSVLARLVRAQVRLTAAASTSDLTELQGTIADLKVGKELLPGNPPVLVASLIGHLIVAGVCEDSGQWEQRAAALNEAATEAVALRHQSNNVEAVWGRAQYLKYIGEDQTALEELRQAKANHQNPMVDAAYALALYSQGDFEKALAALARSDRGTGNAGDFIRGYILAECADGPNRAYQEFQVISQRPCPTLHSLYYQTVLRLLGRKREAVETCSKLREQAGGFSFRKEWFQRLLDYCCESFGEDQLLKAAGSSKWNQCEAHFSIGLNRLAEGDRNGAREHFRKAVATRVFYSYDYDWSRAFLARLEKDPAWPPWIPSQ